MRRTRIEAAICTSGQPCDFTIRRFGYCIATFLEHEDGQAKKTQFTGDLTKVVDGLFHRITYKHQCLYLLAAMLVTGMAQDLADLGLAATAINPRHQFSKPFTCRDPTRRAALIEPAKINELDVEAADTGRFAEHIHLKFACGVPGRLPAHCGVKRKNQPAAFALRG